MKKIIILTLMSINVFAYTILDYKSDGGFYGKCDNGATFSANVDSSGYYIVVASNPDGRGDSKSKSSAIQQACKE